MVSCSYCNGDLKGRVVFCTPSHKVLYHRNNKTPKKVSNEEKTEKLSEKLPIDDFYGIKEDTTRSKYCPHFIELGKECGRCNG